MNDELFFKIAGHNLTIVEVDASYTKPFQTDSIFISPGQTTNALLTANQGIGKYLIAVSPFMDAPIGLDNLTNYATLRYKGTPANPPTILTSVPPLNATPLTHAFIDSLRSLNSEQHPAKVPLTIDHSLFLTIAVGVNPCATCVNGSHLVAAVNNVSFVMPTIALLEAHYYNIPGVFTDDFPGNPPIAFNYTGNSPSNIQTMNGTRLYRLAYNSTVQIVLQGTAIIAPENHPTHLHGFNFFVVGTGLGNFDPEKDPQKFNLVDPVERNTVSVPTAGWTAIRFKADNPGKFSPISCFLLRECFLFFLLIIFLRFFINSSKRDTNVKMNSILINSLFLDNEVAPTSVSWHGRNPRRFFQFSLRSLHDATPESSGLCFLSYLVPSKEEVPTSSLSCKIKTKRYTDLTFCEMFSQKFFEVVQIILNNSLS